MKFRNQINILQFLTLAVGLAWLCTAFAAKPIKVESANPNVAAPSEELTVVIGGSGFNDNDIVEFFFTGEAESPENSDISVVSSSNSNSRGTELTVRIKVEDGAEELSYDIVVRSNGRRGKGTDLFSVKQAGGGNGNQHPTFDVTFHGDLEGSNGTKWQSSTSQDSITYFLSDPQGGSGDLDMSYFRLPYPDGPFTGADGANCFDQPTRMNAVQFYLDHDGGAEVKGSFYGYTEDGAMTFIYLFTLNGFLDHPLDWLPESSTTVTISSWKLKLGKKREDKLYSNISCTGEGSFSSDTYIEVRRNNP